MRVGVVGGGIQGTCVAMELATRGIAVDLIDDGPTLMEGASRHNEGKIHLGFVYANDSTLDTSALMARAAGRFSPLMRRWLGVAFDFVPLSTPFNYAVHQDSLLPPDELEARYRSISRVVRRLVPDDDYFGIEEPQRVVRLTSGDHDYGPSVKVAFSTEELAVSPGPLADLITKTVASTDSIQVLTDTRVTHADTGSRRLTASRLEHETMTLGPYDHVVNCAWRGRLALDVSAGLYPERPWTFRMKYFVIALSDLAARRLPSTTVVLGPFGDVVDYGLGEYFLSWYPVGRLGWSVDLVPPSWPTRPDHATAKGIARDTLDQLASVLPSVRDLESSVTDSPDVRGGVIYSLGDSDVHRADSEFHRRSEVGLRSIGGYHSIDTGKYTTAPLFAAEVAKRICS